DITQVDADDRAAIGIREQGFRVPEFGIELDAKIGRPACVAGGVDARVLIVEPAGPNLCERQLAIRTECEIRWRAGEERRGSLDAPGIAPYRRVSVSRNRKKKNQDRC